jgi:PKD repeat protein
MPLPIIYCVNESDAPQHVGRIQQIAQRFQEQGRISKFVSVNSAPGLSDLKNNIQASDLIIVLLTLALENKKIEIAQHLASLRGKLSNLIIIEIIVDNIQYENEYITLPADLIPIRDRNDMDQAWAGIEKNLDELIPRKQSISWKKYLIPVLGAAAALLVIFVLLKLIGSGPEPLFSYKVLNLETGKLEKDVAECYAPCMVTFNNDSKNYDELRWDFGDTVINNEGSPDQLFVLPGEQKITLTAVNGGKEKSITKSLNVMALPYADFQANNNGCIAPCEIEFSNLSEKGKSFSWDFGDNTQSQDKNPKKTFQTAGEFKVSLAVVHENNKKSDTIKVVTILADPRPFPQFTVKKQGKRGQVPRTVLFENTSKNADQYIWNFGDGTNDITTAGTPNATHVYSKEGTYTVVLTAKGNNEERTIAAEFYIGPLERIPGHHHISSEAIRYIDNNKEMKKKVISKYRQTP